MFTYFTRGATRSLSAVAAVVVVGLSGLVMERGHAGAVPAGRVELGELVPLSVGGEPLAALPELVVSASRLATLPGSVAAELPRLSELTIVGQRELSLAATGTAAAEPRG